MADTVRELEEIVEQWLNFRRDFQGRAYAPNQAEISEFVQRSNHLSKRLVSLFVGKNQEWIEGFAEVAMHASVMMKNPELFDAQ